MRRLLSLVCLCAAIFTVPAVAAPVPINVPSYVDMAVDEAHGNVYVTSGNAGSAITVLNVNGGLKTTIEGVVGAWDVVMAHDQSVAYVAIKGQHAIGVIDPATNTLTKIDLGSTACPVSLAQVGDVMWFTYEDCASGAGSQLGSLRLGDGTVTLDLGYFDRIVSSSALTDRMIARTGYNFVVLDVSGGATTAPVAGATTSSYTVYDYTITPDGSQMIATDYSPYQHTGYSTTDLTKTAVYGSDAYPSAVAVRADGMVAAGSAGYYSPDIYLYRQGVSTLWRSYDFGTTDALIVNRGLEFGATDLYVIVSPPGGGNYRFMRITPRRQSTLAVSTSASTYDFGATAQVRVHLTSGSVTNRTVNIYSQPYGHAKVLVKSGVVDASGNMSATVAVARRTTFTATYAGDAGYDPATAARAVAVRAKVVMAITKVVGTSSGYKLVRVGSTPYAIGTVSPNHAGDCVRIQIQEPSGTSWAYTRTSTCRRLNSLSRNGIYFNSTWTVGARARVRLFWDGDTENAAKTSAWAYVKFVR